MDIGRASFDRVDQHLVDELDHGRIVDASRVDTGRLAIVVNRSEIEAFKSLSVAEVGNGRVRYIERLLDGSSELALLYEDGLDEMVGLKLDLIERSQICGGPLCQQRAGCPV